MLFEILKLKARIIIFKVDDVSDFKSDNFTPYLANTKSLGLH